MLSYDHIGPGGGSTSTPLNLRKRMALLERSSSLSGKRILDCGCGPGGYLIEFLRAGYDAVGIEFDMQAVLGFKQRYPAYADRIFQGDLEHIGFPDNSFDFALFNEVLEHVPDDARAIGEAFRVLRPGGFIAVFSPNRLYPFESHAIGLKAAKRNLPVYTPLVPYVPRVIGEKIFTYWARDYWPSELRKIIREKGFKIIRTDFVWQTFENNSRLQPGWMASARPVLRRIASALERTPVLKAFGVSQFIIAMKPE